MRLLSYERMEGVAKHELELHEATAECHSSFSSA